MGIIRPLSFPDAEVPGVLLPFQGQLCCAVPVTFGALPTAPESPVFQGQMLEKERDETAKRNLEVRALCSPLAWIHLPHGTLSLVGLRITKDLKQTGLGLLIRRVLFPPVPEPSSFL